MNFITTSGVRRCPWRLIFSFIALCVLTCAQATMAQAGLVLTISKSNDAPSPVPSGQVFTYTITYSWSGGVGWSPSTPGTLIITDPVPSALDVLSAAPGSPVSTIAGNTVTFTLNNITAPSGSGTVQINVRFKPGVTCDGTRACNIAYIRTNQSDYQAQSNDDCVRASASNKWLFYKDYIDGCVLDSGRIRYRIEIINPAGNDIGGLNLTNITLTDLLPTGATLLSVTPLNPGDWYGPSTGTGLITLTGGPTSLTVQPGWQWHGCYIEVQYPSSSFTAGQLVTNNATLNFETPCSQGQVLTMNASASNTLCNPTPPVPGGSIWKWLNTWVYFPSNPWYTPSWAPGCCGTYYVEYYNSGAVTQSSLVVDDNLPSTVDVGTINTWLPSTMSSVTMDIFCYVSGACSTTPSASVTYTGSGTYSPSGLPGPICRVRWTYTGTMPPGGYTFNSIDVCVRNNSYVSPYNPVSAGDHIVNSVCASGVSVPSGLCTTSDNVVTTTGPNILAGKFFAGKSGTCMPGCSPDFTGPFYPGDVIRWRMVVANVGSAAATSCNISDYLPAGFSYQGNETYYYGPLYWSSATNPTCCSMSSTPPSVIGGISTPSIGSIGTITWTFPTLPSDCSGSVNYLVIEFDAKADDNPTIAPGQYFNTFNFSASNLPSSVNSNPAQVTINGYAQMQVYKEVRPKATGGSWSSSTSLQPGAQAEYRLRIKNTGILSLSNIYLLDITPHVGDITVLPPYFYRGSMFDMPISMPMSAVSGYTYGYNDPSINTKNPVRSTLFNSVVDPTTGVPPLTAGSFGSWLGQTFSFQIQSLPATTIPPGGTQDFYFTATVPSTASVGQTACNSYGVQATPYNTTTYLQAEATQACVTVIPPDHNQCDSIWGDVQLDECCGFHTTVLNTLGSISALSYTVIGGVMQSINTNPCLPSSTVPPVIAGTTTGTLFYSPPCGSPLNVDVHASATTPSGEVCVVLTATITLNDGTRVQCSDTICIHCDPSTKDRCDSMSVKPYLNKNLSMRNFTIYNMKSPSSPICSIKIDVSPAPWGSGLHGGSLVIDGTPQPWADGPSSGYSQITSVDGMPANSTVQFDLGVDYGIGWSGTVTITVYHCDGDSCTETYGPWDANKGGTTGVGTTTDTPDLTSLHIHSLSFSRTAATNLHIRSIAVHYSEPVTSVVAVTGAAYPCDASAEQSHCNDLVDAVHVKDAGVMIELRRDLDDRANQSDPIVTVVYDASSSDNPSVEIIYYDDNGQEVGTDQLDINGDQSPGQAVSGVVQHGSIAAVMGALTAHPNPTSGRCDLGFTLPSAATVDLDLLDARGNKVATVIKGEHLAAGEYHRMVTMDHIPSGTYLVSLMVNGVPSVLRVELTK